MSDLRRLLGDKTALVARPPGYTLNLGADATDVQVAEGLIRAGTVTPDLHEREGRLQAAIDLWRGRPLADLPGLTWFDDHVHRLEHLLLQARIALIDTRLALGSHLQLITEIEDLTRQHPLNEHLHGQLMLALYRAGRQGEALAAYQRVRRTLDDELGVAPGQPLRALEAAILHQDPSLDGLRARTASAAHVVVPAQLPPPPGTFVGRGRELAELDRILGDVGGSASMRIAIVSGTAGIGKTTLAVSWAHRAVPRFPDGQLYVNLRGFDPTGSVVDPSVALRGFVEAFGVPPERIPTSLESQVGLYRSLLAGKRILVILDNARDADQVRPLLPGSPGCAVIVTSRSQQSPLIASEGGRPVTLDLLSTGEAHDLLNRRLGADRVAAEPAAVVDIITRCAQLPLALVIVAARAATHPTFTLATLAAQLGDAAGALDSLHAGDAGTDVRVVFSWSYRTLGAEAGRLFRLLGLHPGPDIGLPAAASLAGLPRRAARALLAELADAHLLAEHQPGRYVGHDLLRAYAAELADLYDSEKDRTAARRRMFDHYVHSAHAAAVALFSRRESIEVVDAQPGVAPEAFATAESADDWLRAERTVLVTAITAAAAAGHDPHAWQLASAMRTYLLRRGHLTEAFATQDVGLHAARRLGDRVAEGQALRGLAQASARTARPDAAEELYGQALSLYRDLDDPVGQALVHIGLALLAERRGRPAESLRHNQEALGVFRAVGNRLYAANALNGVGWSHALLGDYHLALTHCSEALAILEELGDRDGQAHTWDSLGYVHRGLGDNEQAAVCYQHAIDLCRAVGDRFFEAESLSSLGDTHAAAGNHDAAGTAWREALIILEDLGHPNAHGLRAKVVQR